MSTLPVLSSEQLEAYCQRIGFAGRLEANLEILQALHYYHPLAIPFENLSSFTGAQVSLEPDAVFDKLVMQQRGGYCFEQNQLFMRVLQSIGFEVQGLAARVRWMLPQDSALPRTHMALRVSVEGASWLADVGFGGLTATAALALANDAVQSTSHEDFRLQQVEGLYSVEARLSHEGNDEWQRLYEFSLEPYLPVDYETANWYVSTHPESRFVQQLICCRADGDGRHALQGNRYSRYQTGSAVKRLELQTSDEIIGVLQETMRINIEQIDELPARIEQLIKSAFPMQEGL